MLNLHRNAAPRHSLPRPGSTADFWVWTQLSPDSLLQSLPDSDLKLFSKFGIHVEELKKPTHESFAQLMYEKFRVLQMTQYTRVLYMDSDTMPLVNLDYLFHLSEPNDRITLRPNLIHSSKGEPCQGGFFIVHPEENEWNRVQDIIAKQRQLGSQLPYPHFDMESGWGHNFRKEGDQWEGIVKNGKNWHYHGSHSDQGLLYYYFKYVRMDVSIVIGDRIQNWVPDMESGRPKMVEEFTNLENYAPKPAVYQFYCGKPERNTHWCKPIYRDYAHFYGKDKPWQVSQQKYFKGKREGDLRTWEYNKNDQGVRNAAYILWWRHLADINNKYSIGLDIENWDEKHAELKQESPLGYKPEYKDHTKMIENQLSNQK